MKTNPAIFFCILMALAVSCSPCRNIYNKNENAFIFKNKIYADSTIIAAIGLPEFEEHITNMTSCSIIDLKSTSFYYNYEPTTQKAELISINKHINNITYYYNYNLGEPNYDMLFTVEVAIDSLFNPTFVSSAKLPYIKLIAENTPAKSLQSIKTIAEKYDVKIKSIDLDLYNGELHWSIIPRKKSDPIILVDFYNMDKTSTIPNVQNNN